MGRTARPAHHGHAIRGDRARRPVARRQEAAAGHLPDPLFDITNNDGKTNAVGLRFLLDTYIGSNDAVPFTIAGAKELCDTMKEFNSPADVPDYISALEHQDLKKPGTVAHLSLKYGGGPGAADRA